MNLLAAGLKVYFVTMFEVRGPSVISVLKNGTHYRYTSSCSAERRQMEKEETSYLSASAGGVCAAVRKRMVIALLVGYRLSTLCSSS